MVVKTGLADRRITDMADVRELFPGAERQVYLDSAGVSLPSVRSVELIKEFADTALLDPRAAHHAEAPTRVRESAAQLIGARPEQIALIPATSLSLNVAADAIPLGSGDNVVTTDMEFMSVVLPWIEKCQQSSADLRVARHEQGRLTAESILQLVDSHTRAVVLSSVQWTNGFRLDLKPLGEECQRRGIPLVVDAIQQLGALPLDVNESNISFLACGGHKWLTSPSATGFSYVSDDFAARYRPTLAYAPTAVPPAGDWLTSWLDPEYDPIQSYDLRSDASRFELGMHHGALGAASLAGALSVFLDAGPERIAEHVVGLAEQLADELEAIGMRVISPREPEHRSGITTFRAGTAVEEDVALRQFLAERNIAVSIRFTSGVGGVRVSTHMFNNRSDIDALIDGIRTWLKAGNGRIAS